MKNLNVMAIRRRATAAMFVAASLITNVFASSNTPDPAPTNGFASVAEPIVNLLNSLLGPLLAIVVAVGTLYCVLLGVKFAKAEEPQDREKAKGNLKNAIIGFVLIFVLIVALNLVLPIMKDWVNTTLYPKGGAIFD